jgi:UDP-N-acetylglucosamine 4,6-dehydratase
VMKNVDLVIHAAAMKHVNICEENPSECVKTNIHGTEHVLRAAKSSGVKQFIFISTDKAVEPCSVYGDSKQVGEKLVMQANTSDFETVVLRLGNLIGSSGSIVDKLKKQGENQVFHVHNPGITRFADSLENAWTMLAKAVGGHYGGCVIISKLRAVHILDLAQCLAEEVRVGEREIGNFEKKHEKLVSDQEIGRLLSSETFFLLPSQVLDENAALERYRSLPAALASYDSREVEKLTKNEITRLFGHPSAERANSQ